VVFRGTVLDERQIGRIQRLVEGGEGQSRQDLAREVCRRFGWRRPNGAWATRGARQLLVGLQRQGVLRLPAPRRAQGRAAPAGAGRWPDRAGLAGAREAAVGGPPGAPARLGPSARGGGTLVVRPIVEAERPRWRADLTRFHYLGDAALIGESLRYVAVLDGDWVALASWGAAALHNGPRDRYVGWDAACRRANLHLVVNNVRFLMLPGQHPPSLASRVLGATLRRLSRDWEARYGHPVVLAETFVDPARFRGTCYRASNWLRVGHTQGWAKQGARYRFTGQPKEVWLYPLRRDFRAQLGAAAGPGPAQEGGMVLDVEKLPLHGQGGLFEVLGEVADPRKRRGVRHRMQSILATGICAVLAGARSFTAMGEWAAEQSRETLQRLGSRRGTPPSERTYRRLLARLDVAELDRRLGQWVAAQQPLLAGAGVAVDGKTVRGSGDGARPARHLLSAIVHGSGAVLAQLDVAAKTNEITQVEPLLAPVALQGAVVTADALLTQTKIATYLVEDKKADYVFIAKDNQPTLRQDIATLGLDAVPPSAHDGR
jgi:hypothetical protein